MQQKNFIYTLGAIVIVALIVLGIWLANRGDYEAAPLDTVLSFADCEQAGYPVTGNNPRVCTTPDGTTFSDQGIQAATREIGTPRGTLRLTFNQASSSATLTGELARGTPCVNYEVEVATTTSTNEVVFRIADTRKDAICIQVVGEPQKIETTVSANSATRYVVYFEGDPVFSGKLTRAVPAKYVSRGHLALAEDEPVHFIPQAAVSVKYLIDHRSAFDGQQVSLQGKVTENRIGEYMCFGKDECGRGQVVLGLTEKGKKVEGYDVIVITAGGVNPRDFPEGEYVEVQGTVHIVEDIVYVFRKTPVRSKVVSTYFSSPLTIAK